jgi:transposase
VTVFGALDYGSGDLQTMLAPAGDAVHFAAFLDQVVARWSDAHLVLVLDNASYHKTPTVRVWFADHADRVTVLWLPTYSPHLNLIERVWGFAKAKLACHRFWHDLTQLSRAAETIFAGTRATFAAPTYPHITLRQDFCKAA